MDTNDCCSGGRCDGLPRRDFLRLTALAAVGGPILVQAERLARFVPADKGVAPDLFARGERAVYRGDELKRIGMPVGGLCAGQVYLGGDGKLWLWDVFNEVKLGTVPKDVKYRGDTINALGGANYVDPPLPVHPFEQGFALKVGDDVRPFEAGGWSEITFCGEYPMGFVEYRDPACPVEVSLEAFSPFVPLDEETSGMPLVAMRYTLRNPGKTAIRAEIGGWMENPVGLHSVPLGTAERRNLTVDGRVEFSLINPPQEKGDVRPAIPFEKWKAADFGGWTATGDAFGTGPYPRDGIPGMGFLPGGPGDRVVKSYRVEGNGTNVQGDALTGRLVSREFTIERRYVEFWLGGGHYPKTAYLGLVVGGKLVRSATGRQEDLLRLGRFDVAEFAGQRARIEIVDDEKGFWGQIGVGPIAFVDEPTAAFKDAPDFGDMALAVLDAPSRVEHGLALNPSERLFRHSGLAGEDSKTNTRAVSGVVSAVDLAPGEAKTITFAIAWRFPNLILSRLGNVGNHYATRYPSAGAAIEALRKDYARLYGATKLWHTTWNDSTLPHWFLDRTMASASTLASMTCVRFANGRFYGWEGIGCCDGTCGHVWQYAHTVGRLFPGLERSVRERADFKPGVGFHEETGLIDFRGEYGNGYAADAQAGYVLRTLREHQTSPDDAFLRRVYPRARKALEYLVRQDADEGGILKGTQHNTLDVNLYGPSSWLSSLYLAALRAGEELAKEMGDEASARRWRAIFDRGAGRFDATFWNGAYYVHRLDEAEHLDGMRIGDGCEVDQLMGQGWMHQVGLGRLVSPGRARAALKALFANNFLPDVGPFREAHKAGRWYALPGEAGLLVCTFPKGDRDRVLGPKPTWAAMYFNEVWTGTEYQAAGHMVAEGLVDEGFRIVKAAHDRHHPSRRNPWNEVECSDHYVRAMAAYGVFVAVCGYEHHGPKGHLGFAPKVGRASFRAAFTAAEGWGSYRQKGDAKGFEAGIGLRHGTLRLRSLALETTAKGKVRVTMGGRTVAATPRREGDRLELAFASEVRLKEGDELVVRVEA